MLKLQPEIQKEAVVINYLEKVSQAFTDSEKNIQQLVLNKEVQQQVAKAAETMVKAYEKGGCLFAAGNGGSAADAQHLIAELVSKLSKDRTPIKGFALTTDTSILTAIGNDYGYEYTFERQVRGLMTSNDVLLAITTSGNSPNILRALEAARKKDIRTVLLTGPTGGKAKDLADLCILVPGSHTANIQQNHIVIYHTLCHLIELGLVEKGLCQYV